MAKNVLTTDILDGLDDIGYDGDVKDEATLSSIAIEGPKSTVFTSLVSNLTSQLHLFYSTTEFVNPTKDPEDAQNFMIELSGFLSEYGCPFSFLTAGDLSVRFENFNNCLSLLWFLITEVQAAKLFYHKNANEHSDSAVNSSGDTDFFQHLKHICVSLKMSKPPDDLPIERFFSGIHKKLLDVTKGKETSLDTPVIKYAHDAEYWKQIYEINEALAVEYKLRRSMLVKRLDLTISSFTWSDHAKENLNAIGSVYQKSRHKMSTIPTVSIASLLAAREDIYQVSKTSSGSTRHQCAINKVKIGKVPDRGGRTDECEPPPPEMPTWQKRQADNSRGRGGYGRGGSYNSRGRGKRAGHEQRPQSGGQRGEFDQRPQSGGRGGSRGGQSRWGRGRGGRSNNDGGSFEQYFEHGGQTYNQGGFGGGRQVYTS